MAWILVPSLISLRKEFNELAPGRDHESDGSIGDGEHSQNSSDHNPDETGKTPYEDADDRSEVHAIDVDADLRLTGWSMAKAVAIIVDRHQHGLDDRLQNVIHNRRVWSRTWGWTSREYTGKNPHDKHAHFSARYTTTAESDTRPWGLLARQEQENQEDGVSVEDAKTGYTQSTSAPRPYVLERIAERGWRDISDRQLWEYLLEALVASGTADVDGDGKIELISLQARLERIEDALHTLTHPAPSSGPSNPSAAKKKG